MSGCTLSVVLPNYNHAAYLREAIESIATQSRRPDEFLILDDASTDDSLQVIQPYLARFPFIRLIRHERNQGVLGAHHRLFAEARGDYLFAAAADDVRLPGFFERALQLVERFPQAGLVFGAVGMIDPAGRKLGRIDARCWRAPLYADPDRFLREYLLVERPSQSACSGTIYRRDAFLEVGSYRAELGSWSDTFAVWAIGLKYGVCYLPEEVALFRKLVGSFSNQSSTQPRKLLDIIARAGCLMQTEEFRERFPPGFVRRWCRAYRRQVIGAEWRGPEFAGAARPAFLTRNLRRLPRVFRTLPLLWYRGDVSCYDP
ncbi:MAG: glycosyltransferase family A protein [Planctomycetota bacterium]|nr:glycosyltransferase family A protein [Planctomycetota bacterium]